MLSVKRYIRFFIASRQLLRAFFAPTLSLTAIDSCLAIGLGFLLAFYHQTAALPLWGFAVLAILLLVSEALLLFKAIEGHYSPAFIAHLRFYRINRRGVTILGSVQALPACLLTGVAVAFLALLFKLGALSLVFGACSTIGLLLTTILFLSVLLAKGPRQKQQCVVASAKSPATSLASGFFKNKYTALLFRDLKIARRSFLLLELPGTFLISLGILLFAELLFSTLHEQPPILIQLACSYLSYLLVLLTILTASVELQGLRVPRHHLQRFRLCPQVLQRLLAQRLAFSTLTLGLIHLAIGLIVFSPSFYLVIADLVALVVVFSTLYLLNAFLLWLLARETTTNIIIQLLVFIIAILAPLGMVVGLVYRRRIKHEGHLHA